LDHIDILQEMLRYIDIHIKEEMNVEKPAKMAVLSDVRRKYTALTQYLMFQK